MNFSGLHERTKEAMMVKRKKQHQPINDVEFATDLGQSKKERKRALRAQRKQNG